MRRVFLTGTILGLFVGSLANHTRAASITWGAPQQISGDSDVMTNGTLDRAYGLGSSGDTVNGVTFGSILPTDSTNISGLINNGTFGSGPLSGPYANLVSNGIYDNDSGSITLNGLVTGDSYEIEVWVNDSRSPENTRSETISGSPTILFGSQTGNGLGHFIVGTFIADSTGSQALDFEAANGGIVQVNALQLRVLSASVPEPSSFILSGIAVAGMMVYTGRRRKARRA